MNTLERVPIIAIEGQKSSLADLRTCLAGSRFKVWTDAAYPESLLPLYRTLSPRLALVDIEATPKVEGGLTAVKAMQALLQEFPTACVVATHTLQKKYLLGSVLAAGASGHIMRPYTCDRVLEGIGAAIANREQGPNNRRNGIRVPARLDFFYKEPSGKMWSPTRIIATEDVCESGARVRMDRTFPSGEELKVALRLQQQGPPMWMRARVARCHPVHGEPLYDLGFAFVEIEEQHKARLQGYVREQISNGCLL